MKVALTGGGHYDDEDVDERDNTGIQDKPGASLSFSGTSHTLLKRGRTIAGGELQILLVPLHPSHSRRDNCLFLCGPATHKGFGTVVHAIGQSEVRIQSGTTMSDHGVREVIPDETRRDETRRDD
jgi:hypothetical protein